jgi:GGDEF domain-containing protein
MTLDSIGDAVISSDTAGRVSYLNRAAEAMTGWAFRDVGSALETSRRMTYLAQHDAPAVVAAKLLDVIARPYTIDDDQIRLTASAGGAVYPGHGQDPATLIANADAAMYRAKRTAQGTFQMFDPVVPRAGVALPAAARRRTVG